MTSVSSLLPSLSPSPSPSPSVPDLLVDGVLKATHGMLDKGQLELIKGLVDKNLGEPIEQFETPSSVIKDPVALVCVVCVCGVHMCV